MSDAPVVIMGAGPAGLTAAYELSKHGMPSVILEANSMVGGIARRPSTRATSSTWAAIASSPRLRMVKKMWHEVLGDDLIRRPRLSRIFYNNNSSIIRWSP